MDNVGTMDFFGHQDVARRKTSLLVVYYILAVCFIIAAVYGAFALVIFGAELKTSHSGETDLTKIAADPAGEARLYGMRTGTCACCGRELTDPNSIEAGIGPICAENWGL